MTIHVVADITGHGYGHLAQIAPVLVALREAVPGLRITVRTHVAESVVREMVGPVTMATPSPFDIGLKMHGPVDVDGEASAAAYAELHADWPAAVAAEASLLAALRPDLLISNIGYVGLAGAAAAGVPSVALSSLNWADMYHCYCGHRPESARIHGEILAAYRSARRFIQLTPHMPMTDLPNRCSVGPVVRQGPDCRAALQERIGLRPGEHLAVVTLGGIAMSDEVRALPRLEGLRWLVAAGIRVEREDILPAEGLGFAVTDLIKACDVVVTKPGYGTIVGAVCAGTKVISCTRDDWPETAVMWSWAERHGAALMISREDLAAGDYGAALARLLEQPRPAPYLADGALAAARLIREMV
ncbi:MAG: hypothetical protein WCF85_12360 [Rhodospirillaceae bacterium]